MSEKDARIAQMMRVMEVLHTLGLSVSDALLVLKAFYEDGSEDPSS